MPANATETGIYIGGAWADSEEGFTVYDKYTLQPIADLKLATESHVEAAVESAVGAARKTLPPARSVATHLIQ